MIETGKIKITTRVLYKDTDKAGVVYYANYLHWFEMGRSEFMRNAGYSYNELEKKHYVMPVVESFCRYHAPAAYDDVIDIETCITEIDKIKLKFYYYIFRQSDKKLLAEGYTLHICTDEHIKVKKMPESLIKLLTGCSSKDGK